MKKKYSILIATMVLCCSGCIKATMTSSDLDKVAKEFAPPADKSYIYVMRQGAFAGGGGYTAVLLVQPMENVETYGFQAYHEKAVGFLANDTYVLFEVPPSKYEVVIGLTINDKSFREKHPVYPEKERIKLVTLPGHMYFIAFQINLVTDSSDHFYAELLTNEVGKKAILDYGRVVFSSLEE